MYSRDSHSELTGSRDWHEHLDLKAHRYMQEDTRLGLPFLGSVAAFAGVDAPLAAAFLEIGSAIAGDDFRAHGRTLGSLGLGRCRPRKTPAGRLQRMTSIACLGAGRMGRGIAVMFAYAGYAVDVVDFKPRAEPDLVKLAGEIGREIQSTLAMLARIGLLRAEDAAEIAARVSVWPAAAAGPALARAAIIFESVPEILGLKREALARASRLAGEDTIIASTTSTILVADLADALTASERFLNAHWLNPAFLMPLVELSPSVLHVPHDDVGRGVAVIAEGLGQIAACVIKRVAAAPIDEFEQPEHSEAKAETVGDRLVDVLGAGDAFLGHPGGFIHREAALGAEDDVARARRADDRHLADRLDRLLEPARHGAVRRAAGSDGFPTLCDASAWPARPCSTRSRKLDANSSGHQVTGGDGPITEAKHGGTFVCPGSPGSAIERG